MIKNNTQMTRAFARLQTVHQQIEYFQDRFSGTELEILTTPLIDELEELEAEIREYRELQRLSLEEAVQGLLNVPMILDNIGELLAKLRIAAGLTQEGLATQLGWQQSNLSRFESENYHSQTIAKVVEYAGSLGVWLHVTPSLTEKPPEVIDRSKEALVTRFDIASTSSDVFGTDWTTSPYHYIASPQSRKKSYAAPYTSGVPQEEPEVVSA